MLSRRGRATRRRPRAMRPLERLAWRDHAAWLPPGPACARGSHHYAEIDKGLGRLGIRVDNPDKLSDALREGLANTSTPTVIDVVVTSRSARTLPAAENRTLEVAKGDFPV